jgi:restriction system protein
MDPRDFEDLACQLFERLGYEVEPTEYVGDSGADGYLYRGGEKTVMQCKRVKGSVGEPVLRDLFGTMHASGLTSAIVMTTGKVSDQARRWVDGKPIRIIELDELRTLIEENFTANSLVPDKFTPPETDSLYCPKCRRPFRKINRRRGSSYYCTGYPKCRYTRSANRRRI